MTDPLSVFHERVTKILNDRSLNDLNFTVEHPRDFTHGDVATNVALVAADTWSDEPVSPRVCADELCALLQKDAELVKLFTDFSVAGPGFVNAFLKPEWLAESVAQAAAHDDFGHTTSQAGRTILVEFTDPNPFKEFHIGHLMSNSIGEAMARLQEFTGADVKRLCYQGDVGMHIAKAVWGLTQLAETESFTLRELEKKPLNERILLLGRGYTTGARQYEDASTKDEINALNAAIYARTDDDVNEWYDAGRAWSLAYFDTIYARLGTTFTKHYFESETGVSGLEIVKNYLKQGVFKESDGAVIFPGEEYGLHSRVFINAMGLPTYEAKELGLTQQKGIDYPKIDASVVVTASEITDYFAVVQKALSMINPDLASKTLHRPHGMLRLTSGKMSSRTGDVVVANALLDELAREALTRMSDPDEAIADQVGVAAIKYAVLKTSVGKDIVYDPQSSLAFEGNTGPYLQYTFARTASVLRKAEVEQSDTKSDPTPSDAEVAVQRLLYRFPMVVALAAVEYAPSHLCTYLFEVASRYNELYAKEQIVGGSRQVELLTLTQAVGNTLKNGLTALGIPVPERL